MPPWWTPIASSSALWTNNDLSTVITTKRYGDTEEATVIAMASKPLHASADRAPVFRRGNSRSGQAHRGARSTREDTR
jgi:hypothetical protein